MTNPIYAVTAQADRSAEHLETIWEALHEYRENCIPEGEEAYDAIWESITFAMEELRVALGLPDPVEADNQPEPQAKKYTVSATAPWQGKRQIFGVAVTAESLEAAAQSGKREICACWSLDPETVELVGVSEAKEPQTRTITVTLTFDATACADTSPDDYDPTVDLESMCEYGAENFNLLDWKVSEA